LECDQVAETLRTNRDDEMTATQAISPTLDRIGLFLLGVFFLAAWAYFARINWNKPRGLLEFLGYGSPGDSFWRLMALFCLFAAIVLFTRAFGAF
jgi:hypothetical protein